MKAADSLIMVAMSGGVDSSTVAWLLKQQGHDIAGMFMKNWEEDDVAAGVCTAEDDADDARQVCRQLGIPFHGRNFAMEYWEDVFEHFLAELRAGRTPNPDILCNREIKFRVFLEHARDLGAGLIATGHYARRRDNADGSVALLKGVDPGKDQSYFLYALDQQQLSRAIFPLGELEKSEVRRLAAEAGLSTAAKKDSTGICFIGERNFDAFIDRYLTSAPGEIRTPEERVIGRHRGLIHYTLGQRKGLEVGGVRGLPEAPWFVVGKDLASNVLYAVQGGDHPLLMSRTVEVEQLSWISGQAPPVSSRLAAKTRYRQPDQACRITAMTSKRMTLVFDRPQRAVTPGQSAVLYDGEVCLGGGVIAGTDAPVPAAWQPGRTRPAPATHQQNETAAEPS